MVLTKTVPAYPYKQYDDDEDITAWFSAYNDFVQEYVDWFGEVNLPNYTGEGSLVSGALLDWVGVGLYGYARPVLSGGAQPSQGAINGAAINVLAINASRQRSASEVFATTDDTYRRCLTWQFYKGDGRQFAIRWLKRRVMRFLTVSALTPGSGGIGAPEPHVAATDINQTYRISVTFGPGAKDANINIKNSFVAVKYGPINAAVINAHVVNGGAYAVKTFPPFPRAAIFKKAVDSGVIELPFSYNWTVNI
jgi:hypothetical protein